jgi:hypothetical protein
MKGCEWESTSPAWQQAATEAATRQEAGYYHYGLSPTSLEMNFMQADDQTVLEPGSERHEIGEMARSSS